MDEYQYQCMVRWLLKKRLEDRDGAHKFLYGDGKKIRGWNNLHPNSPLEKDSIWQWNLGNRGEYGDWR